LKSSIKEKFNTHLYLKSHSRAFFTLYGLVIKELRVCFSQFFTWRYPLSSLVRTIGILGSSLLRLVLGRHVKYSFAFTGEDRLLESLYKGKISESGFYVDVGCNHPVFLSNTYLFYRRGWRGVCIDANQQLINKFKFYRPRDYAVCALVSNQKEQRMFYQLTNSVLSTTETKMLDTYREEGQKIEPTVMETFSLTEIFDRAKAPHHIDILSIDTEEHDWPVLQSLDFEKYAPMIIVIEADDFIPSEPNTNEIYRYLMKKGYSFEGFLLTNLYFRRK
jgi:hypothetical protein